MTEIDDALRDAVRHIAAAGRPVSLADRALAGAGRRRRRRAVGIGGAAMAATVVAVGVTVASPGPQTTRPTPPIGSSPSPERPVRIDLPGAVVAGYVTERNVSHVLDPETGRYREIPYQLAAVSPRLDRAVVSRRVRGGNREVEAIQYGVYEVGTDTVQWLNIPEYVLQAQWSPDGRTVVFCVAVGLTPPQGYGWLVDRLVFVDTATGETRQVAIDPAAGWEPQDLLGWTMDGGALALLADRVGTDQAPWAHVLYDRAGTPIAVHEWSMQANAGRVLNTDLIVLTPLDPGPVVVRNLTTGEVVAQYQADRLPDEAEFDDLVGWLDTDQLVLRRGTVLLIADTRTGSLDVVANLPTRARIELTPVT